MLSGVAQAQPGSASTQPTGPKTLVATMGVYVYPTKGQTPEQRSMEEVECYDWAVDQTQTDPTDLAKQADGAAAVAIAARRKTRKAKTDTSEQIEEQSQAAQQAAQKQLDNYKKAFAVCLETQDCMVE